MAEDKDSRLAVVIAVAKRHGAPDSSAYASTSGVVGLTLSVAGVVFGGDSSVWERKGRVDMVVGNGGVKGQAIKGRSESEDTCLGVN